LIAYEIKTWFVISGFIIISSHYTIGICCFSAKTYWLGIMCSSGGTCLPMDCCFFHNVQREVTSS
jgi:hypothetical protein